MNRIAWFFDLYSQYKASDNRAQAASDDQLAPWRQVVVYLACVVGIMVGPYALDAATGTYASFLTMFGSTIRLFWAIVFGFVLTAFLFKTVFAATTALVVQIGAAIVSGFASGKVVPKAIGALTNWVAGAGTT